MSLVFSIKELNEKHVTEDPDQAERWRRQGKLVICTHGGEDYWTPRGQGVYLISKNGGKKVLISLIEVEKILYLLKRGYTLPVKETKPQPKPKEQLNDVLQKIADAIESTNAQKAQYFREATPYIGEGKLLVVDFPTNFNLLKQTQQKYLRLGRPSNIVTLYHGTAVRYLPSIFRRGILPGRIDGLLGRGIYVGSLHKASGFSDLIILQVKVVLGRCKELVEAESLQIHKNEMYESLHAPSGNLPGVYKGFLYNEEWVVRTAEQVEVSKVVCKKK